MKTKTLLLLGGAALAYYYWHKTSAAVAATPMPTADDAATDTDQTGATAVPQNVIVVQPDDSYDAYYPWGWGPSWGGLVGGGGGHHHGGGGHGGGHGGHH